MTLPAALFREVHAASEPSALNHDECVVKVFQIDCKFYICTGLCYYGHGLDTVCLHEVVGRYQYGGRVTMPSEWERRGISNYKGIQVRDEDGKPWVTVKTTGIEAAAPKGWEDYD